MRDLVGKKRAEVVEFIVVIARHFADQRAFAVHDLVVAEREDEILGIGVGHGERQRVMVALAPQRVEGHIFEHVVHPTHVPLEEEAETAVIVGSGDQREGRGFLRDHHDRGTHLEGRRVESAQEVNGLEVFPAAEAVGLELLPIIVQVQHGSNCIDSNPVDVKIGKPIAGVGDEEGLHLRLAVVVDPGRPVRVLVHHGVGELVAAFAVELKQAVFVLREMRRDPVEDHADPRLMASVDELHELLRRPVAVGGSKVAGDLVAPGGVVGVFHDRQELDMGVAHILDVGDELRGQLFIIQVAAVVVPLPGSGVDLVDIDRPADGGLLCHAGAVGAVMPAEAVRRVDDAGGLRQRAAAVAVGIGLVDRPAGAALHAVFIGLSLFGVGGDGFPHTAVQLPHGKILCVPEIKITDDMDGRSVRRPDTEHIAAPVFQPVAAEIPVCIRSRFCLESFQKRCKLLHPGPLFLLW